MLVLSGQRLVERYRAIRNVERRNAKLISTPDICLRAMLVAGEIWKAPIFPDSTSECAICGFKSKSNAEVKDEFVLKFVKP